MYVKWYLRLRKLLAENSKICRKIETLSENLYTYVSQKKIHVKLDLVLIGLIFGRQLLMLVLHNFCLQVSGEK